MYGTPVNSKPGVITASHNEIETVTPISTAGGCWLYRPKIAIGVESQSGRIIVAIAPDFGFDCAYIREWITHSWSAVQVEPHDLAEVGRQIVCCFRFAPVTRADEEISAVRADRYVLREIRVT